jgi:hypothetical protein
MTQPIASTGKPGRIYLSIGIIAWNEERNIARMLDSLFRQSLFERLSGRGFKAQIVCAANGCADRTVEIATEVFERQSCEHPFRDAFECRALDIRDRGKVNAWNTFVHKESSPDAQYLLMMDADILIDNLNTLASMVFTLEENPMAWVTTDEPRKHFALKARKSLREALSLVVSDLTRAGQAQLCGQLYCIRSSVARRIFLPRDIGALEDGFIKAMVCTDFLTEEINPNRIVQAPDASHIFEAYATARTVLKNQKRQMIGQTVLHILVDDYLRTLSKDQRLNLARTLEELDRDDPNWVKRLIAEHLARTRFFWRLIPGAASLRFRRLARLRGLQRIGCFPAAVVGFAFSMAGMYLARRALKAGHTQYWPHSKSGGATPPAGLAAHG